MIRLGDLVCNYQRERWACGTVLYYENTARENVRVVITAGTEEIGKETANVTIRLVDVYNATWRALRVPPT